MKVIDVSKPYKMRKPSYDLDKVHPSEIELNSLARNYKKLFMLLDKNPDKLIAKINDQVLYSFEYKNNFYLFATNKKITDLFPVDFKTVTPLLNVGQVTIEYLKANNWRFNVTKLMQFYVKNSKTFDMTIDTLSNIDDNNYKKEIMQKYDARVSQDMDLSDDFDTFHYIMAYVLKNIHVAKSNEVNKGCNGSSFAFLAVVFDKTNVGGSMGEYAGEHAATAFKDFNVIEINNSYAIELKQTIKNVALNPKREIPKLNALLKKINN